MKDKIDFFIGEIIRLENFYPEKWEEILRYFVKINSILSDNEISDIDLVIYSSRKLLNSLKIEELKTISNIYISQIFYNRANILNNICLGDKNFKKIPDFVDKRKLKVHLYDEDPVFKEKGITIRGGWRDIKPINSFTFNI